MPATSVFVPSMMESPEKPKSLLLKKILHYLLGAALFISFTLGSACVGFLLMKDVTEDFTRRGFENNFFTFLFLLCVTPVAVIWGTYLIISSLRKNGHRDIANGMIAALIILIAGRALLSEIMEERPDPYKNAETQIQTIMANENARLEAEALERTRREMTKSNEEILTESDSTLPLSK